MVSTFDDETERLRSVFDVLDSERTGFISVERFIDVASEHFCNTGWDSNGHESITAIIQALDPTRKGQIQFVQFCEGITKFMQLTSPATSTDGGRSSFEFRSPLPTSTDEDDNQLIDFGADDVNDQTSSTQLVSTDCVDGRLSPIDLWSPPSPSSNENHPDFDRRRHHHRSGSAGYRRQPSSLDDDRDSGFGKLSDQYDSNSRYNGSEDQNIEYLSEESSISDEHVVDLDTSSSTTPRGTKLLKLTNGNRLTPSSIASTLYRSSNFAPVDSSRQSSGSDAVYDDIDGNFVELNDKVKLLENRLQELTEDHERNEKKQDKLKEENSQLIERVHYLEEQLRDVEYRANERVTEEHKKHRDLLSRTEKDKSREIEILSQSLQRIERDYVTLKDEAPSLRSENERLRKETSRQEIELETLQQKLASQLAEFKILQEHSQNEQAKATKERIIHMQLVDELSKELEEQRSIKAELMAKSPSNRNTEMSRDHRRLLEEQLSRMRSENAALREQTDELQAQLLHRHVEEGRQLLLSSMAGSLAAELENVSQDELKDIISKEREANAKLRDYIERITLRILEKNPSILEIGSK